MECNGFSFKHQLLKVWEQPPHFQMPPSSQIANGEKKTPTPPPPPPPHLYNRVASNSNPPIRSTPNPNQG